MVIVGIDPGLGGGLCTMDMRGRILGLRPLPSKNMQLLAQYFSKLDPEKTRIFLEKVQVMGKCSARSMLSYGLHAGEIVGYMVAFRLPFVLVPPITWCRVMHTGAIGTLDPKEKSFIVASRLFPGQSFRLGERSRGFHDGLVDATMLAEYGRRQLTGMMIAS